MEQPQEQEITAPPDVLKIIYQNLNPFDEEQFELMANIWEKLPPIQKTELTKEHRLFELADNDDSDYELLTKAIDSENDGDQRFSEEVIQKILERGIDINTAEGLAWKYTNSLLFLALKWNNKWLFDQFVNLGMYYLPFNSPLFGFDLVLNPNDGQIYAPRVLLDGIDQPGYNQFQLVDLDIDSNTTLESFTQYMELIRVLSQYIGTAIYEPEIVSWILITLRIQEGSYQIQFNAIYDDYERAVSEEISFETLQQIVDTLQTKFDLL